MDGAQTKITLFIPWIGQLCDFHCKSLESLVNITRFKVVLICDQYFPKLDSEVIQLSYNSVFNCNNPFGLSRNELEFRPYKFCDLKPWLPEIFNVQEHIDQFWGWADIDLLVSHNLNLKLNALDSNERCIYGSWGHLMFGQKDAMKCAASLLYGKLKSKNINYWESNRSYALDEKNYFHKALNHLNSCGELVWRKDLIKVGDLDPNWISFKVKRKFYNYALLEEKNLFLVSSESVDYYDYVHFQKFLLRTWPIDSDSVFPAKNKAFSPHNQLRFVQVLIYTIRTLSLKIIGIVEMIKRRTDIRFE